MNKNNQHKLHYKMYKSGKMWIIMGIISTATILGLSVHHIADASTTDGSQLTINSTTTNDQTSLSSSAVPSASVSSASISSATSVTSSDSTIITNASASTNSNNMLTNAKMISSQMETHLKTIGQDVYYYNDSNNPANSLLFDEQGNLFYFDSDGKLSSLPQNNIQTNVTTITTDTHNKIFSQDDKNITNTNGFITANSWYRPQYILKSGQDWMPSSENDFRPILSVWWPSKLVQVKYVNYMNNLGLGKADVQYTNNSTQESLNAAVKDIQANIEKKISTEGGKTEWLSDLINNFVKSQPQWNMDSEGITPQTFQGGTIKYNNSSNTPYANTDYRLLNRYPTNQTGTPDKKLLELQGGGSEFLLANDIDNSNPAVQSEQLNWLYYLMNFGSITQNDSNANFDSYRVDAVDNVDADLLQVASNYFKVAYKINQNDVNANNHIPILEDWSFSADPQYINQKGANQLTMDYQFKAWEAATLMKPANQRISLENMIKTLVNRENDNNDNKAIPNYSFIRAHDSEVQTIIQSIITAKIDPNSAGNTFTQDQLKKAFAIYNADEKSTNKQFTPYNIPSGYALLLTNKDTVPRVYYGDMYTDDGQYMAHKTPYYDAIKSLMTNRIKYVSGGQAMRLKNIDGNEVLTSVRYGQGINKANQKKTSSKLARTSGMALIMTNNPNAKFNAKSTIIVNTGKIHAHQKYQLVFQSTKNGIATKTGHRLITDKNGVLKIPASYLNGKSNPQISGSVSMWVPVGAKSHQDIRVAASNKKTTNGKTYHSNPALDSHLIFEGFSNFQDMPTKQSEYTNVLIAKHAKFFANLGVTYFELAPQYRSSTDSSFIDSIIKNGYSFTDRYDLGYDNPDGTDNPTKYGTANQLADAIRAIHNSGMKAIADWVPDQVYNLPNAQVVSATRTDSNGTSVVSSNMTDSLYYANTLGSGNDYQSKYGGAFLSILKHKYPELFRTKMISNGKTLPTNELIKRWDAKYMNGTNIQGSGTDFVLSNTDKDGYFKVPTDDNPSISQSFLPQELLGNNVQYGFTNDGNGIKYQTISGYQAKNTFYHAEDGNWYYFDQNCNMVTKPTSINGVNYYFLSNGINLRNVTVFKDGKMYYYQGDGKQVTTPGTYTIKTAYPPLGSTDSTITTNIHVNADGTLATGVVRTNTGDSQYFNDDGTQVIGKMMRVNGNLMYFNSTNGNAVTNQFFQVDGNKNNWYHTDKSGFVSVGLKKLYGSYNYFDSNGAQVKGAVVRVGNHQIYLDSDSGEPVKDRLIEYNGNWYYAGKDTHLLTGLQKYKNQTLYFDRSGIQIKGQIVSISKHKIYLDVNNGALVKNKTFKLNGKTYYANKNGFLSKVN